MKRVLMVLCVVVAMVCLFCACGAKESPVEDFDYVMKDGEIIITGYHGSDREISIPAKINGRPVTTIGEKAFKGYDMTEIIFPKSLVTIEKAAFIECKCLTKLVIPGHVKVIGENAFARCEGLIKVVISEGVEIIEKDAFEYCTALESVSLPNSLKHLGHMSFYECTSLKELVIPDNFDGFVIEYMIIDYSVSESGKPVMHYGDMIRSPVSNNSETVLVVKKGSAAESALENYGHGKINYRVR